VRKWKGGRYGKGQILLLENSGLLLILSEEGQAVPVAAEPSEHRELASFQALEGKTWNHPVLVGDRLYLRNSQEAAAYRVQLIYLGEQLGAQPFDPTHNACNPSISPVKPKLIAVLLVAFLAPEIGNTEVSSDLPKPGEARMIHFVGALPKLKAKSAEGCMTKKLGNAITGCFLSESHYVTRYL